MARSASVFRKHTLRNIIVVSLVVLAVSGASIFAFQFANANTLKLHIHPTLSITLNGSPHTVPAQIGIISNLWKDHSLDQYGAGGLAPLHTHDASGTIHVESNTVRNFTLAEFLAIWGEPSDGSTLDGHQVASITANGSPVTTAVVLVDKLPIVMTLTG